MMFCYLVGSIAMSARLDPEDMREVLGLSGRLFRRSRDMFATLAPCSPKSRDLQRSPKGRGGQASAPAFPMRVDPISRPLTFVALYTGSPTC